MPENPSVLVACDFTPESDPVGHTWLLSLIAVLKSSGWAVHVLTRDGDEDSEENVRIRYGGAQVITPRQLLTEQCDRYGVVARYRAREVIARAAELLSDHVLVQGLELSWYVANSGSLKSQLWSIPLDFPYRAEALRNEALPRLKTVAENSARVLVSGEEQRSYLDAELPSQSSKFRVLPLMSSSGDLEPDVPESAAQETALVEGTADVHLRISLFDTEDLSSFERWGQVLRQRRHIPRLLVHPITRPSLEPSTEDRTAERVLSHLPGTLSDFRESEAAAACELIPLHDPVAAHYGYLHARSQGRRAAYLRVPATGEGDPELAILEGPSASATLVQEIPAQDTTLNVFNDFRRVASTPGTADPLRVVVAGSDFKFAGDLVEALLGEPSFDVRFDVFTHHAQAQPTTSVAYLEWADVILSEFASQNAIWYSKNLRPGQKLIVHLHGFELLQDWIEELAMENVALVVVASEFYRQKAHSLRGWPLEKIAVIPNSVNPLEFARPKLNGARFHVGLVGIVPILKRPDRALDLLELLLDQDERYTLHVRGHAPWNYLWEWKKSVHQDAYRDFYDRIGSSPRLRQAVAFEPFAPDMPNWLRKIGWVLSPSTRETFHLAAIEGAVSGAVPLAWRREGAEEIIGSQFTFDSTADVADFIARHNGSQTDFDASALSAQSSVTRYHSRVVGELWVNTISQATTARGARVHRGGAPAGTYGLVAQVEERIARGEFDEAKGLLDRHIELTTAASGRLKILELFVRGMIALNARRVELSAELTSVRRRPQSGRGGASLVRVMSSTSAPRLTPDPELLLASISVRPFAARGGTGPTDAEYTGEPLPPDERRHRSRAVPIVSDALDFPTDFLIEADHRLRFDRWVEVVASEVTDQLHGSGADTVLIDGPWHIALPSALGAVRAGLDYWWSAPEEDLLTVFPDLHHDPYTSDLVVQFSGLLAGGAQANLVCGHLQHRAPGIPLPRKVVVRRRGGAFHHRAASDPDYAVDQRLVEEVRDLAASLPGVESAGPFAGSTPGFADKPEGRLRVAVFSDPNVRASLKQQSSMIEVSAVEDVADLNPAFDVFIVDRSVTRLSERHGGPHKLVEHVRRMFDAARAVGVLGVFNSPSNIGGSRDETSMAEKADAIVGTKAVSTDALLLRNPNSLSRVSSAALLPPHGADLRRALRRIGVGLRGGGGTEGDVPTAPAPDDSSFDLQGMRGQDTLRALAVEPREGVSLVLATRGGRERLPAMLASISRQTMAPALMELVVVHNGPDDGTAELVSDFAAHHPALRTVFLHSPVEGASEARNLGIEAVSRDYVTFVDDDDELEVNYVLNLWLSADEATVVAGPLCDRTAEGLFSRDTPNNRRLAELESAPASLNKVSGLLGLNACKLIPSRVVKQMRYPEGLHSGEDVVFMSQLLLHRLKLVPADRAPHAGYIRHLREDSVSRRVLSREFAVDQRLHVIRCLERVRKAAPPEAEGCLRALQNDQVSFIARYVAENPGDGVAVLEELSGSGFPLTLLAGRHKALHALSLQADASHAGVQG